MNSCGNSNIGTRLRGPKYTEAQEESINQGGGINKEDSSVYGVNDFNVPRNTLVICQRTSNYSSDHGYTRFKPRLNFCFIDYKILIKSVNNRNNAKLFHRLSGVPRNEFRMARGSSNADRARGGARGGRAFKKTVNDRDSNSESSYLSSSRPKFQESLKNHENSQGKYYDDKRLNGELSLAKLRL